jgi:stage II sporulation protein E
MGVMEYSTIPCVTVSVSSGDQIIMMTDGVVDSMRDDLDLNWLRLLLRRIKSNEPQTVSDLVIRQAAMNYGQREKDDMTVVAFRV